MPNQSWRQRIMTQQGSGSLLNTFTTAKSVINSQAIINALPANFFSTPGIEMTVTVRGAISNIVTTPGTITFQVMLGSVVAWSSGAVQLNATAHTTLPFTLIIPLTCQVVGGSTTGKLIGIGQLSGVMFTKTAAQTDGVNTETVMNVPVTAPAQGTGFDSTAPQILDFWAGFSISNAGNGIQIHQYSVDSEN